MYPVFFVSLGPGEPDLITLKGLKILQSSDCIFYPATTSRNGIRSSRAYDILSQLDVASHALAFDLPMSKDRSLALAAYDKVYAEVGRRYRAGERVAIVAEGDAGFYSSVHYVFDRLAADGVEVKHIAGIPAFIAGGALAGIHIAKQEEELNVVPGLISVDDLIARIDNGKVLVIMKVSQCAEAIKDAIDRRPDISYHYFENIGVDGKEYHTTCLEEISTRDFPYFSLMIIHK